LSATILPTGDLAASTNGTFGGGRAVSSFCGEGKRVFLRQTETRAKEAKERIWVLIRVLEELFLR
jgi:hypothetical protein